MPPAAETGRSAALAVLRTALDDPAASFRPGQWEAIDALANRRERLLVVEQTGWGKSAVYFVATRILRDRGRGLTLIVSPLLALMRNQIEAAERLGIRALTINSGNADERPQIQQAIRENRADALLISPERLANDAFVSDVLMPIAGDIGLLVVDEAHCISDWGHDFRPDYRRLLNILRIMPGNVPIVGTTATANDRVIEDVRAQLGNINVQRGPLMRQSLALQVMRVPDRSKRLAWLAEHLDKLPGTGIVYTLTTRDADRVAEWLNENGIVAKAYYGDAKGDGFADVGGYRLHLEDLLVRNEVKALVATTALGMGYDKPDLGFVIHYQAPGSTIAYYQQIGRAGRAIDHAICVLMAGGEDEEIQDYFRDSAFPREESVRRILESLEESDGLTIRQIEELVNLPHGRIEHALKFLSVESPAPVLKDGPLWRRTAVSYEMDHERIRRLTEQRKTEWNEVQRFVDERGCLMEFLARSLDDERPQPCGKCANCVGGAIIERTYKRRRAAEAIRFLRRSELPLKCNRQVAKDAFVEYGFKGNLQSEQRAEIGRILSRWRDAGWGELVAKGKHGGHFGDELVEAAAEMIRDRWRPEPVPAWITCVPSANNPELVPNFAARLGNRLGLPFLPLIEKAKDNEPQKLQQNRFHQCRNLDGVFTVVGKPSAEPVL
ncbi:MAG: RecQ family ATP-dependent DNA helicase, partial [Alphaproteobacteria bacterium]|nr:RecQ family ATP-dependent DNA helicase [Alphaproteobacteria bacterium]